jgi:hypothetical protein
MRKRKIAKQPSARTESDGTVENKNYKNRIITEVVKAEDMDK